MADSTTWRQCAAVRNLIRIGQSEASADKDTAYWPCRRTVAAMASENQPSEVSAWFQWAASAKRASAGSDFEPVLSIIDARWFSTVR